VGVGLRVQGHYVVCVQLIDLLIAKLGGRHGVVVTWYRVVSEAQLIRLVEMTGLTEADALLAFECLIGLLFLSYVFYGGCNVLQTGLIDCAGRVMYIHLALILLSRRLIAELPAGLLTSEEAKMLLQDSMTVVELLGLQEGARMLGSFAHWGINDLDLMKIGVFLNLYYQLHGQKIGMLLLVCVHHKDMQLKDNTHTHTHSLTHSRSRANKHTNKQTHNRASDVEEDFRTNEHSQSQPQEKSRCGKPRNPQQ